MWGKGGILIGNNWMRNCIYNWDGKLSLMLYFDKLLGMHNIVVKRRLPSSPSLLRSPTKGHGDGFWN